MRFFGSEKTAASPTSSLDHDQYTQNYPGTTGYDQEYAADRDSDLNVPCPSHTTERKLVTRIDWHVLPFLCILYLLAFLDRVNIANANVYGLATELGLESIEYNTALVIFFVPYILFEIPSNICELSRLWGFTATRGFPGPPLTILQCSRSSSRMFGLV